MTAAVSAAEKGADVTIFEKNSRLGKKLLMTGNGRCNFTNADADTTSHYHGENAEFVFDVLNTYTVERVELFFKELGIFPVTLQQGKAFPASLQASSMVEVLEYRLNALGVHIRLNCRAAALARPDTQWHVSCGEKSEPFDAVVLAAGGCAAPKTGSDGSGFALARKLGHSVVTPYPVLSQMAISDPSRIKPMNGVKRVCRVVTNHYQEKRRCVEEGDVLFTEYGLSGPPILELSGLCAEKLRRGEDCMLGVSLFDMTKHEMKQLLEERLKNSGEKSSAELLLGLIHSKMIRPLLSETRISPNKRAVELHTDQLDALAQILTLWEFKITDIRPFEYAQATGGGVNTWEVNSMTMESFIAPKLYFSGEVLDVYGDCGGYNLHWAWASGLCAGENAAQ